MHDCHIDRELVTHGLRKTKDRHEILSLFDEKRAWSVAQIHNQLKRADLSTIYRNVQKLSEEKLLVPVHAHDGEQYYERAGQEHHDHKLCTSCHTAECVPCPAPTLTKHILELFGRCSACT